MYTIKFNQWDTERYRRNPQARQGYIQSADQQMASRLEVVQIIGADETVLYKNERYKGPTSDAEWNERITQAE